jgi:hypothetical protein
VWAFLPVGDSTTYSRAICKAVRDAVRAVLAARGDTAAAAGAVRQITVRLSECHGDAAVSDLVDALALELADANITIALINDAYAEVGDEHDGLDRRFDDVDRGFGDQQGSESGKRGP